MLLSAALPLLAPRLPNLREMNRTVDVFTANYTGFGTNFLGMALLKSFAMLVERGEGAPPQKRSGDPVIGKPQEKMRSIRDFGTMTASGRTPEARYAYYSRCQQFRRNGEQCKAPAMKGEAICYRHDEQAAAEERRARQRRELLATPGLGFGDFRAVQRTISATVQALLDGRMDSKTAGQMIVELQTASQLLWQHHLLNHRGHKGTRRKEEDSKQELRNKQEEQLLNHRVHEGAQRKEELTTERPGKEEGRLTGKMNPRGCRTRRCSAVAGQLRRRSVRSASQPGPAAPASQRMRTPVRLSLPKF
jgi:hypothetical protein